MSQGIRLIEIKFTVIKTDRGLSIMTNRRKMVPEGLAVPQNITSERTWPRVYT